MKQDKKYTIRKHNKSRTQKRTQKRKSRQNKGIAHSGRDSSPQGHTYTTKHYESGDGMLTSVWGPGLWHSLHTMSFNYPVRPTSKERTEYRKFFLGLRHVLPCKYCRINFQKNLECIPLTPVHMKNRDSFSRYIYQFHELVNATLHKTSGLTYEDVRERYEHFRARCGITKTKKGERSTKNAKMTRKSHIVCKQGMIFVDSDNRKHKFNNKHKGCVEPMHKVKSRAILKIVPLCQKTRAQSSIQIDRKCLTMK